jgi:hypothetical protein
MQKQEIKSFQSGKEDIKLLAFTESIWSVENTRYKTHRDTHTQQEKQRQRDREKLEWIKIINIPQSFRISNEHT